MSLDVLALVDADEIAALLPAPSTQAELLDLHRQLLTAAPERGEQYRRAAMYISHLADELVLFDGADPRTVSCVLTSLIEGLRRGPLAPAEDLRRFDAVSGWLDHLRIESRVTS